MISQRVIKRFCMVRALREKSLNPFNCRWTIGKSEKSYEISHSHAFTLIELLIVIAIIAILGSATVLVLNPVEIIKQGRDGTRITDVENIQKSLNLTLFNNPSLVDSLLSTNIYLSLPSGSCPLSPPTGYTYVCNATSANINKTDGTGWIPLTLQNMASLPTDPNSNFYYAFIANPTTKTFTVTALLESEKQTKLSAAKDGGTDPGRFEKGDVSLWSGASGLQGYWTFDESGTVSNGQTIGFQDFSGNNNNGTATNTNGTGMTFVSGISENGTQLDGVDDSVTVPHSAGLMPASITVSGWIKFSMDKSWMMVDKAAGGNSGSYYMYNGSVSSGTWSIFGPTGTRYNCSLFSGTGVIGNWYHLVGTFDSVSGQQKCYFNGELKGTTSGAALGFNTDNVFLGKYTSGYQVGGTMDDIRIYNKALSADEIKSMYNAYK